MSLPPWNPKTLRRREAISPDVDLITVYTLLLAADVQLHIGVLDYFPAAFDRVIRAGQCALSLVKHLVTSDYCYLDPIIAVRTFIHVTSLISQFISSHVGRILHRCSSTRRHTLNDTQNVQYQMTGCSVSSHLCLHSRR